MILVGPPGAGKGTQAADLVASYDVAHVSTGDMLREAIRAGTELGRRAAEFMNLGQLVPDDVVIAMVVDRIAQPDCENGFVLDGFPRTRPQAEALDAALRAANVALDFVLVIELADELVVDRITGRRLDPETGEIYHVVFKPPPPDVAGRVVQRVDDTEEAVRERLVKYHSETAPIIPYYDAQRLLRRVDGDAAPAEVSARIAQVLEQGR